MVRITVLADNTVATPLPRGLRGEWGFAAAVDDVLFDTGGSGAAVHDLADWLCGRLETFCGTHCTGFEVQPSWPSGCRRRSSQLGSGAW